MTRRFIPLYGTRDNGARCAFYKSFGLKESETSFDATVEASEEQSYVGCNVARVSTSTHCEGPHLEVVSHILNDVFPCTVSDALVPGIAENAVLISPQIESLAESKESYPVGNGTDMVISKRQLIASLNELILSKEIESLIVRVRSDYLPCYPSTDEIQTWPYLTVEAAEFISKRFNHLRTNAPSIERQNSHGGMWSHCIFFGVDPDRRTQYIKERYPQRTIGELFSIPPGIPDREYSLICPYQEVNTDCAMTLPLLFIGTDR